MASRLASGLVLLAVILVLLLPVCLANPIDCMGGPMGGDIFVRAIAVDGTHPGIEAPAFEDTAASENRYIRVVVERAVERPSVQMNLRVERGHWDPFRNPGKSLRRAKEPLPIGALRGHRGRLVIHQNYTVIISVAFQQ